MNEKIETKIDELKDAITNELGNLKAENERLKETVKYNGNWVGIAECVYDIAMEAEFMIRQIDDSDKRMNRFDSRDLFFATVSWAKEFEASFNPDTHDYMSEIQTFSERKLKQYFELYGFEDGEFKNSKYKYHIVDTGNYATLSAVITSGDIRPNTKIRVITGTILKNEGYWYEEGILQWLNESGTARTAGNGKIDFSLAV